MNTRTVVFCGVLVLVVTTACQKRGSEEDARARRSTPGETAVEPHPAARSQTPSVIPALLREETETRALVSEDSMTAARRPEARPLHYSRLFVSGYPVVKALRDSLGKDAFQQVLKVNRIDLNHVRKDDSLIVPDGLREAVGAAALDSTGRTERDSLYCSPFPRTLAIAADSAKLILVSIRMQAFGAYEHGRLVRWGPTSTGRKAMPTPVGLYHVNWKDRERTSSVNDEWLLKWCLNIDNMLGISLHEYALPGTPASHSCVRLASDDAEWLYGWAEQWKLTPDGITVARPGTPVLVFGEYAYGKKPAWRRAWKDPEAATVTEEEIEAGWDALVRKPAPIATLPDAKI